MMKIRAIIICLVVVAAAASATLALLLMMRCVEDEGKEVAKIPEILAICEPEKDEAAAPKNQKHYIEDFVPTFSKEPLPTEIIDLITGTTFHENTPFGHDFLAFLTITPMNFYGESQIGHMIVAEEIAYQVLEIFQEIYMANFPIYSMILIDHFDADDNLSLAANNSSAFNFRYIAGTNVISRHGFGMAIDINPVQNPYVRGENVLPAAGRTYLDRTYLRPGMIVPGCVVYTAFVSRGWTWGGNWSLPRDYHHFEIRP